MSLLYTVKALDPASFQAVIALIRPSPELERLYQSAGISTVAVPKIPTFEHTTAGHLRPWAPRDWLQLMSLLVARPRWKRRVLDMVAAVDPDIIHLNSVVLAPIASVLRGVEIPLIWHVREHPARGVFGIRRSCLSWALRTWPTTSIFISEADRTAWGGQENAIVIPNFVPLENFDPDVPRGEARLGMGLDPAAPVVLFMGGVSRIKGVMPLLESLARVREQGTAVVCLMPGALYERSRRLIPRFARAILPRLGLATPSQAVMQRIRDLGLSNACLLLPFRRDINKVIAAADVVVFPALKPHFARPVIEAGAMARPVVASDLPGIRELVVDQITGVLVPPGDVEALSRALLRLLQDSVLALRLGVEGRKQAERRFAASVQGEALRNVYRRVLHG